MSEVLFFGRDGIRKKHDWRKFKAIVFLLVAVFVECRNSITPETAQIDSPRQSSKLICSRIDSDRFRTVIARVRRSLLHDIDFQRRNSSSEEKEHFLRTIMQRVCARRVWFVCFCKHERPLGVIQPDPSAPSSV